MGKIEVKWEDLSIDEKELLKDMYFKLHPAGWRRNRGGFSLPHSESQKWFDPVRYSEASNTYYGWEPDGKGGMKRDAYGLDRKQPSRTYKLRAVLKEFENEELVKGKHEFTKGRKDVDSWYTMT